MKECPNCSGTLTEKDIYMNEFCPHCLYDLDEDDLDDTPMSFEVEDEDLEDSDYDEGL
jgi:uncharacterized protein (DUF983 family)